MWIFHRTSYSLSELLPKRGSLSLGVFSKTRLVFRERTAKPDHYAVEHSRLGYAGADDYLYFNSS